MPNNEPHVIHAIYHDGTLRLLDPVALPEGARVEVAMRLAAPAPTGAWAEQTPAERVEALHRWLASPRPEAPVPPLAALSRESLYD